VRAAGAPFSEVLRSRVLSPLDMDDTAFYTTEMSRLATGYRSTRVGLVVFDEADGDYSRPRPFDDAGSGLVSTVDELNKFATMLLCGGVSVLSDRQVLEMTRDQLTPAQKVHRPFGPGWFDHQSWGYGICVRDNGAFGWDGGLGTPFQVDPLADLVVIVPTQRMFESPDPPQVHKDIQAAAYEALT
jgi:CubicO group peptidase (beta-lactamase class C family)